MNATVPDPLAAALADRYTLERELGRGGMATVDLARDPKHDRAVALKVLRPELAAALGADRFLREIRITAQLAHPHILPLLDSGRGRLAALTGDSAGAIKGYTEPEYRAAFNAGNDQFVPTVHGRLAGGR